MTDILKVMLAFVLGIGVIVGIYEFGFRLYEYYNPKYEQVRRNTYEQSRAFREGTVRDLENLALEFARASPEAKAAIRITARHRLANIPDELLTSQLLKFKAELDRAQ